MSHSRRRPITGRTPTNSVEATYVIVEMSDRPTTIQCVANGTVTFQVASTIENITYDTAGLAATWNVNDPNRYVAPADAVWTEEAASGSVDVQASIDTPVFAIRIDQTAGTGSVTYTILQA